MGTAEKKEVIRRLVDEVWNQRASGAVERFFTAHFRNNNPNLPFVTDRNSFAEWVAATRIGFPDVVMHLEMILAEDDFVMTRWTMRGTHLGPVNGIEPSGALLTVSGMTIYRMLGDQVLECWWSIDVYSMLKQIGAFGRPVSA
jgi:predicted ester cyclase